MRPFYIVSAVIIIIMAVACKKEEFPSTLTVEVTDYSTGSAIEGAKVKRVTSSDFDLSCFCFQVVRVDSLGRTDSKGLVRNLLSFQDVVVEKEGYYTASEYYDCAHERTDYRLKLQLFRKSRVKLIANTTTNYMYPEPLVEVGPVLKDGTMLPLSRHQTFSINLTGSFELLPVAGDMNNRIVVLKRNSGSSKVDTLFKTEIFVPVNTVPTVIATF